MRKKEDARSASRRSKNAPPSRRSKGRGVHLLKKKAKGYKQGRKRAHIFVNSNTPCRVKAEVAAQRKEIRQRAQGQARQAKRERALNQIANILNFTQFRAF